MDTKKPLLKKALLGALLSTLALSGCVAVPAYGPSYYGPPAPAVVVRPYGYYGYSHYGHYGHYGHRYWR